MKYINIWAIMAFPVSIKFIPYYSRDIASESTTFLVKPTSKAHVQKQKTKNKKTVLSSRRIAGPRAPLKSLHNMPWQSPAPTQSHLGVR